jgi:uncharacterized protein YcbK (DUF882 family)
MKLRYFSLEEFNRASSNPCPEPLIANALEILSVADAVRHVYGNPLRILNGGGYRNPEFNGKVGGKKNSLHLQAMAVDLRPVNNCNDAEILTIKAIVEDLLLRKALPTSSLLGVGVYLNRVDNAAFIHIDVRKGVKARWEDK